MKMNKASIAFSLHCLMLGLSPPALAEHHKTNMAPIKQTAKCMLQQQQASIQPGAVYDCQPAQDNKTQNLDSKKRMVFNTEKSTFHFSFPLTGIGFDGGYTIEKGNQLKTWDLNLPQKIDQTFTIGANQLTNTNNGDIYKLVSTGQNQKRFPNPFLDSAAPPIAPVRIQNPPGSQLAKPELYQQKTDSTLKGDSWQSFYSLGETNLAHADYKKAEFNFLKALEQAETQELSANKKAKTIKPLLSIYEARHDYANVEKFLRQYQNIIETVCGPTDSKTIEVIKKRITVLRLLHKEDEAKTLQARIEPPKERRERETTNSIAQISDQNIKLSELQVLVYKHTAHNLFEGAITNISGERRAGGFIVAFYNGTHRVDQLEIAFGFIKPNETIKFTREISEFAQRYEVMKIVSKIE
ncbi:hypothetical protein KBF38_23860 [bacterium]|nr:hypothetical protein [bacterium]